MAALERITGDLLSPRRQQTKAETKGAVE